MSMVFHMSVKMCPVHFFFLIFHFKMVKLKEHAGDLAFFFLNHILLKKSQVQLYIFNKLNRARRS